MADLSAYIGLNVELNFITGKIKLTDPNNYPSGVAADLVGIFTITQPDGLSIAGAWTSPEIYYSGGSLVTAERNIRLKSDNTPQEGTYTIRYEVDHPGYTPTVLTRTFIFSYTRPTQVINKSFDLFTPELVVTDGTTYNISGFSAPTVTRAWQAVVGSVTTITGTGTSLDLAYGGQYYDAAYDIQLQADAVYTHPTYTYLTVRDRFTKTLAITANTPPSIPDLLGYVTAIKERFDTSTNCSQFETLKREYKYAFALYRHTRDRICAGDTIGVYDYIQEILNIYNNRVSTYVNTNAPIPAYDTSDACSGGSSSSGNTVTLFEYLVGTTSGAPTAGTSSFTKAEFANCEVLLFAGRVPQSRLDDGSGAYYSKPLASTTLTLTGMEFESGVLYQFLVIAPATPTTDVYLEYKIGTTSGAPTDGTNTFSHSSLAGRDIMLYIGRVPQSQINDGSGTYFSKPTASTTITLNGMTWETGTIVQIIIL